MADPKSEVRSYSFFNSTADEADPDILPQYQPRHNMQQQQQQFQEENYSPYAQPIAQAPSRQPISRPQAPAAQSQFRTQKPKPNQPRKFREADEVMPKGKINVDYLVDGAAEENLESMDDEDTAIFNYLKGKIKVVSQDFPQKVKSEAGFKYLTVGTSGYGPYLVYFNDAKILKLLYFDKDAD